MKRILLALATVGTLAIASLTPAMAQGGCGPYGHRGWDGYCRPGGGWGPHRPWGYGNGYGYGYGYGWHHRHWDHGWGRHRGW